MTKTILFVTTALFATACGGKAKPAPAAPANSEAQASSASQQTASGGSPGDTCYYDCLSNGPADPAMKADWGTKTDDEKQFECSAQCADEAMSAEEP